MNPRPRLRPELRLVEQVYRGELGYILKDPTTYKYFRFRPIEAVVLQGFDGRRTPVEIAAALAEDGIRVSAAVIESFARKLSQMGLMQRTLGERTTLELERLREERQRRQRTRLFRGDITRMRWSVGDPDAWLDRTMPRLRWCFGRGFLWLSIGLFATYFLVIANRWTEFYGTLAGAYFPSTLTLYTILLIYGTSMAVVAIHELGHAYTCKHYGGKVHEMGFMLLYFQPCFYCNVNDAWSFPELKARLWVTAAGSWIQFVIAGMAAIVWWAAAPGTFVSDVAFATMLVGGVTAIMSNMNPLIPLDGYFALSDWLEIPNLRQRAFGHLSWWLKRHVLRLAMEEPAVSPRERQVFLWYGALAAVYIVFTLSVTALIVGGWASAAFGGIGVMIVIAWVAATIAKPLRAGVSSVALAIRAKRAMLREVWRESPRPRRLVITTVALLLVVLVLPRWLTVTGDFTAAPAGALALVAPELAVIRQISAREGARATPGEAIARLESPELERVRALTAQEVDSLAADELLARGKGWIDEVERLAAERASAEGRLRALDARRAALTLRVRSAGEVLTPRPELMLGRRKAMGDTVLLLAGGDSVELRIRIGGGGASLVAPGQTVSLVPYGDPGHPLIARIRSVAAVSRSATAVEARVLAATGGVWLPGTTGEASVRLRRSTVAGALWWGLRKRLRTDLLL